jgi:hypothetical protein
MQTSAFRSRRPLEMRAFSACGASIRCTARVSRRPVDFRSLEMQSDAKASVAQPLTIDNPSLYAQIARGGADHQRFIRVHLRPGNDAQATRTDVLRDRTLRSRRFPEAGNLHRHSQWGSSFTSSRPQRHVVSVLPCKTALVCTGLDDANSLVNRAFSRLGILPTIRWPIPEGLTAKSLTSPGAHPIVGFPQCNRSRSTCLTTVQLFNPPLSQGRASTEAVFLRTWPRQPGSSIAQSMLGCAGLWGRSAPLPN